MIERAIALGTSTYIRCEELPLLVTPGLQLEIGQWDTELKAAKKAIIERALRITGGNGAAASRLLGLNRKYFSDLCKELGVKLK